MVDGIVLVFATTAFGLQEMILSLGGNRLWVVSLLEEELGANLHWVSFLEEELGGGLLWVSFLEQEQHAVLCNRGRFLLCDGCGIGCCFCVDCCFMRQFQSRVWRTRF